MDRAKKATLISTSVATLLVFIKLLVGIFSGSVALLASAIDSMLDLSISLFNYFALHNSQKEADETFHFGRNKLEPLASVIEGLIISISALFILYEALHKLVRPTNVEYVEAAMFTMILSMLITLFLVIYLNIVSKETNNMVIKADALHYKTDLFSNGAILLSLFLVYLTNITYIDIFLAIAIAIYMIYSAYPIIKSGLKMLLDIAISSDDLKIITDLLESNPLTANYHHLQTRESGSHMFVAVHIVFNVSISLYDAHLISDKLELKIKKAFKDKKVHILIHMDPYDDSQINELEE